MKPCGTRSKYVTGCRCAECRQANAAYQRDRERHQRRVAYGVEVPIVRWVDPTEAREHLAWLSTIGIGRRTVAEHTGLSLSQLRQIAKGFATKIKPATAERILTVGAWHKPGATLIDATHARNQIADLKARGWSNAAINERVSGHRNYNRPAKRDQITVRKARLIDALWRQVMTPELLDKEAERDRKRAERARAKARVDA